MVFAETIIPFYTMRTSHRQFTIMIEFMEKHGDISKSNGSNRDKIDKLEKWVELVDLLNSEGSGDARTGDKWRKTDAVEEDTSSVLQAPATESEDALTADDVLYEFTPISEDEWKNPRTTSQPAVTTLVPDPSPQPPSSPPALAQTDWEPPTKKKREEEERKKEEEEEKVSVLKLFKEYERKARDCEKERERKAQELERERIRQRDVELQLQAQWLQLMKDALGALRNSGTSSRRSTCSYLGEDKVKMTEGNNNNVNVIKLEGARNWNLWKFQTTVQLRGHGWLNIVEGKQLKPEVAAEIPAWESKDAKAQTLLVTRMSEEAMLHIITCTSSAEMWRKLHSVYEQKTETSVHIIQQRFFQYKFERGVDMSVFLSKIQELQNQLKQMGEEISDKFVITKVLMSLPDEYKHFISAWESAPDDKQTFENLVARLLIEEERVKERNEGAQQATPSAFFVKNKGPGPSRGFKFGKSGQYNTESNSNNKTNSEGNMSNNNNCFYCGKFGHFKAQCRFRKQRMSRSENKTNSNAFVVSNLSHQLQKSKWLVDSGATEHMCRDRALFTSFSNTSPKPVIIGNGAVINAIGYGQITVQVSNGNEWIDTVIDNVLYVPELKTNLFSVNRATDKGYVVVTDDSSCKFYESNKICAVAERIGNSFYLNLRYNSNGETASTAELAWNDLNEWHRRLAHQNFTYVKDILRKNNIVVKQTSNPMCESCLVGKIHRLPFNRSEFKSTRTCELIHVDTCGPMEEPSVGGSRYFVLLTDDYSNFRSVYFVKTKDRIKYIIEDFINKAENNTGNKVKTVRSDNGLEFVNRYVKEMFTRRGITHQTTVPYTPEQNGKAERENRTLVEAARTMIHERNLPKKLWAEAINTAVFVLNRTGKSHEDGRSPYEVWTGKTYNIMELRAFGTEVYVHIPKEKRLKWDPKGERGLMVGYEENVKGYRIYYPEKNVVETKRDIVFLQQEEKEKPLVKKGEGQTVVSLDLEEDTGQENSPDIDEVTTHNHNEVETSHMSSDLADNSEDDSDYLPCSEEEQLLEDIVLPVERSKRERKKTDFYKCNNVQLEQRECDPITYREAMSRSDARGFEQQDIMNLSDIFAPVAKLATFRLFVVIATKYTLPIHQMDVTGAFLYGNIKENVYVRLPEGAYSGENNIVKLNKSLYGLKSSPKAWNIKVDSVLIRDGFIRSKCDPCLYKKYSGKDKIFLLIYVDDLLIFGSNESDVTNLKTMLSKEFKMKDLGLVSEFLGIHINQNLEKGITTLSQRKYLENVLKRFNMEDCKPMLTPLDSNLNTKMFDSNTNCDIDIERVCRQIIGCLMYAVSGTRPDLCFAVSLLSRYQKCANSALLSSLKRVLRYVKHTLDYKIVYKCDDSVLQGYCDADWGGDQRDRKSTSGYLFTFANCLVMWCSKKQSSVSLSSTEAEYVSMSMAASEACWLVNLLHDFDVQNDSPVKLYCDNQGAILNASTDSLKHLKHVDIRYHFVKDLIKNNKIDIQYINTCEQLADMLTKSLSKELLIKFLTQCNVKW
nr:uncharacterized protein LOC110381443 isoform X2 [Helicoverpa armigera]